MNRPERPRIASIVSPNVGIRVPRNFASNHAPASSRLTSASVKSASIHRRVACAALTGAVGTDPETPPSTSVVRSSDVSWRRTIWRSFGQLEIELDEGRALVCGEPERGHGVFRRVGRGAAMGDEPGCQRTRLRRES